MQLKAVTMEDAMADFIQKSGQSVEEDVNASIKWR